MLNVSSKLNLFYTVMGHTSGTVCLKFNVIICSSTHYNHCIFRCR